MLPGCCGCSRRDVTATRGTRPGATTTIPLVNARIMHRLIPHSQLHVYHGGHLELGAGAKRLAPVVEAFLDADLTAERNRP
jgi:hypothetical protein